MDLNQTKAEIERRLQEKEEEFEATRKNFARALDSMQASLGMFINHVDRTGRKWSKRV